MRRNASISAGVVAPYSTIWPSSSRASWMSLRAKPNSHSGWIFAARAEVAGAQVMGVLLSGRGADGGQAMTSWISWAMVGRCSISTSTLMSAFLLRKKTASILPSSHAVEHASIGQPAFVAAARAAAKGMTIWAVVMAVLLSGREAEAFSLCYCRKPRDGGAGLLARAAVR